MSESQEEPEKKSGKPTPKPTVVDILFDGLEWCYNKFMRFVSLNDDDPFLMTIFKLITRVIGILIMVAISPFVIFGIIITILAVS